MLFVKRKTVETGKIVVPEACRFNRLFTGTAARAVAFSTALCYDSLNKYNFAELCANKQQNRAKRCVQE